MGMLGNLEISGGTSGTGSGSVTHTSGALTANQLVIGNGADDLKTLGTLGTTTTLLHGNAAGAPTFGAVVLTTDVSGDLPFANLVPATAISVLVGRGAAAGAGDFQEITLGTGLTMTATTLSVSGGVTETTGTFTPTMTMGTSGSVTLDTSFDTLAYVKLGSVVHITGYLSVASVSSPLGFLAIGGLPYTSASTPERAGWGSAALFTSGFGATVASPPIAQGRGGTTDIYIFDSSGGGAGSFGAGDIIAGAVIQLSYTYFAA